MVIDAWGGRDLLRLRPELAGRLYPAPWIRVMVAFSRPRVFEVITVNSMLLDDWPAGILIWLGDSV